MKITKIKYFPVNRVAENNPLVVCSVILEESLILHNIKVFPGNIVVYPQKRESNRKVLVDGTTSQKKSRDLYHPINPGFSEYVKDRVLEGYELYATKGQLVYIPLD